jgi:septal ring factor EnvC (AmiA/AmiB activator)
MNGPRITNDDRGLTINKTLAYASLVVAVLSVMSTAFFVVRGYLHMDANIAALRGSLAEQSANLSAMIANRDAYRAATDTRLRSLEEDRRGSATELVALRRDLGDLKAEIRALNATILQALRNGGNP